jgi:hypothetical protein
VSHLSILCDGPADPAAASWPAAEAFHPGSVVGLLLGGELAEAVVGVLHLVGDGGAPRVGVAGLLAGPAGGVEAVAQPADGAVYARADRASGVGRQPRQQVAVVAVQGACGSGGPNLRRLRFNGFGGIQEDP